MATIMRKLIQLIVVFVVVTFFTVVLISLIPGKPEQVVIPFGTDRQRETFRKDVGLDKPIPVRYVKWLNGFIHGDLGNYYQPSGKRPVGPEIVKSAIPVSLLLMLYAQTLSLLIAIPLGVFTAYRAGSRLDRAVEHLRVRHDRHTELRAGARARVLRRSEAEMGASRGIREYRPRAS